VSEHSHPAGLAEELARLVQALDGMVATGSEDCRLCPVCRLIAFVRDRDDTEVRHVVESVGVAAASLLGLLDSVLDDRRLDEMRRRRGGVEHIDIG